MCIFSSADRKHEILRRTLCGEKKTDSLRSLFSIKGPFLGFFYVLLCLGVTFISVLCRRVEPEEGM